MAAWNDPMKSPRVRMLSTGSALYALARMPPEAFGRLRRSQVPTSATCR